jgi:hypothetical protein
MEKIIFVVCAKDDFLLLSGKLLMIAGHGASSTHASLGYIEGPCLKKNCNSVF